MTIPTAEAISGRYVVDKYIRDPTAFLYYSLSECGSGDNLKLLELENPASMGVFAGFASCNL